MIEEIYFQKAFAVINKELCKNECSFRNELLANFLKLIFSMFLKSWYKVLKTAHLKLSNLMCIQNRRNATKNICNSLSLHLNFWVFLFFLAVTYFFLGYTLLWFWSINFGYKKLKWFLPQWPDLVKILKWSNAEVTKIGPISTYLVFSEKSVF